MTGTSALPVDASNAEQLRAWDGDEGAYWAEHAEYFDRSVAAYHERLLAAANITGSDRVLDIGCGTGQTTRDAARAAAGGAAVGVDLSARMLDYARRRAAEEGVTNASFEQVDAQIHPFPPESFDVAISRTGAMFFGDLAAAFTNIGRALVPGGRLVLVAWQPLPANEWIREISAALAAGRDLPAPPPDAPGPFSLSDPDRVRSILDGCRVHRRRAGGHHRGHVVRQRRRRRPPVRTRADGLDARRARRHRPRSSRGRLRATMAAHETSDGVLFGSAAWTIRATRA